MYPALVLVIVNQQRSIVDTYGFSTVLRSNVNGHPQDAEHHPATVGHLSFAAPAPSTGSVTDNEPLPVGTIIDQEVKEKQESGGNQYLHQGIGGR